MLDFVPLQVTKWGNEEWSKGDVQLMRERLNGRFIYTPFYFNPELNNLQLITRSFTEYTFIQGLVINHSRRTTEPREKDSRLMG